MSEVSYAVDFELGIHCKSCRWSMPLDELRAKGGRTVRKVRTDGITLMEIETPAPACPRCNGALFVLRFAI